MLILVGERQVIEMMNDGPVSPYYLEKAKQGERRALQNYRNARKLAIDAAKTYNKSQRDRYGRRDHWKLIETLVEKALEMRDWWKIAIRHRESCEKRGTIPFGGRISPNAQARHKERYRK